MVEPNNAEALPISAEGLVKTSAAYYRMITNKETKQNYNVRNT